MLVWFRLMQCSSSSLLQAAPRGCGTSAPAGILIARVNEALSPGQSAQLGSRTFTGFRAWPQGCCWSAEGMAEHICSVCTESTPRAGWMHHVFNIFGKLADMVARTWILGGFFKNSLKYAKHIYLSINIAVKSVTLVIEEELFSVLAFLSSCNGFWLHASPKPCVVVVRHDISPSVRDAEWVVNHVLFGFSPLKAEQLSWC